MKKNQSIIFVLFFCCQLFNINLLRAELVSDSVYQLNGSLKNQNNQALKLSDLEGKIQVVSLIYTHCLHTCPTIVSTMQFIEKSFTKAQLESFCFSFINT
ncbi:MAG: protein SCO1/2 [Polaribacter sp.]|jgi:protein SCO1/2